MGLMVSGGLRAAAGKSAIRNNGPRRALLPGK
jgi:hypothetical protein